ncbi:hypothetical protein D7Z26_13855 [Cohnella endophytica]|uniref:Butirosin biosynthesis protein H N-terminal domain-containing protein n=1 Tax=Cohnella endophytica TaxID=2419778 RepID=A0A494XV21_9BACL|nr:hypothetical protein [Cohnella endophytica]RKP54430.1 hypothetical protein D7Z26_13855 [Cohnella endophytica]
MKKKLDMNYPVITSYPMHANIISILAGHKCFEDWLYNNHLQVASVSINGTVWAGFYNPLGRKHYPLINKEYMTRETIVRNNLDICDLLIKSIDQNKYAYMGVDTFYIKSYNHNHHFNHDLFIYGYNEDEQLFYIADFFGTKYSFSEATFTEVSNAFHSTFPEDPNFNGIQLLSVNHDELYTFDLFHIIEMIWNYLNSTPVSRYYKPIQEPIENEKFGLSVYEEIKSNLISLGYAYPVLRNLHILCDHKKLMVLRSIYIDEKYQQPNEKIIGAFEEIEKKANIIRNLYMKNMVSLNKEPLTKFTYLLEDLQMREKDAMECWLERLRKITG